MLLVSRNADVRSDISARSHMTRLNDHLELKNAILSLMTLLVSCDVKANDRTSTKH